MPFRRHPGLVHGTSGLPTGCLDQHHQHGGRDGVHAVVHSALAPGLDVSWLSGAGICSEPASGLGWSRHVIGDWLARPAIDRGALGKLVKLGGWQFAAQGGALIAAQADRYLLGALLQPQFVGFYTIAQRLEEAVYIGVLKVGEILFPFFSTLQKEADDRKADLLFRSSWILNVLAASALGGLIPVAGPLLHLWTGAEVATEAQNVLVILSIAGILDRVRTSLHSIFWRRGARTRMP